jgi:hypothetical protein
MDYFQHITSSTPLNAGEPCLRGTARFEKRRAGDAVNFLLVDGDDLSKRDFEV